MSKVTENQNTIDYTDEFKEGLGYLKRMAEAGEAIVECLGLISSTLSGMKSVDAETSAAIKELRDYGTNPNLGIYTVGSPDLLSRAMAMGALKTSGQLEGLKAELKNPTPLPHAVTPTEED